MTAFVTLAMRTGQGRRRVHRKVPLGGDVLLEAKYNTRIKKLSIRIQIIAAKLCPTWRRRWYRRLFPAKTPLFVQLLLIESNISKVKHVIPFWEIWRDVIAVNRDLKPPTVWATVRRAWSQSKPLQHTVLMHKVSTTQKSSCVDLCVFLAYNTEEKVF